MTAAAVAVADEIKKANKKPGPVRDAHLYTCSLPVCDLGIELGMPVPRPAQPTLLVHLFPRGSERTLALLPDCLG